MLEPNLGFRDFTDSALKYSPEHDHQGTSKLIPYGITYLDRMLHGIMPDDLVLIGAPSGVGKSELANHIAFNAALSGKRVVAFALEAHKGEWELRAKYKMYTELIRQKEGTKALDGYTYLDFKLGYMRDLIKPYREVVEEGCKQITNLKVFYRDKNFGIAEFKQRFAALEGKCQLVVIDHLHYFDVNGENENKEFGDIIKAIRDMNQVTGIPVVLVGHLRKSDARFKPLVAGLEEFHGTSSVPKVATTIITINNGSMLDEYGVKDTDIIEAPSNRHTTYFRICKARAEGQVTRYIGIGTFDSSVNAYDDRFLLAHLTRDEKKFIVVNNPPPFYVKRSQLKKG